MRKRIWEIYSSFYFIGIGGVSMSALAKFLVLKGAKVGGSDNSHSVYTEELSSAGVKICVGNVKESIKDYDVIIYTDAVKDENSQLAEARKLNKIVLSRGQLLAETGRDFNKVIAVSGCHGKTTVTSMLAHIFYAAKKEFCAHIGGRDRKFSNLYYCGNTYFLTEACEYKQNFLLLKPSVSVVLNTDPDHLECYGSAENLKLAYMRFAGAAEISVIPGDDFTADGITFGYGKNADYYADNITENNGKYGFCVYERGQMLGEINLNVYGKHNVINAVACVAVARATDICFGDIKKGLSEFCGVERRFENIGKVNGAEAVADYAHHPDEIRAAIATAKSITKGKLFVIFQPHTYSRTKNLFNGFIDVLSSLDNLLVYRTFAAREYFDDAGSALTLSQHIKNSRYGDGVEDIKEFVSVAGAGDTVLFLGAGDIYDIAKELIKSSNG